MCHQIAGVNSVMYYGTEILRENGLDTQAALVANIANGVSHRIPPLKCILIDQVF
jgi:hypothetical protein